MTTESPVREYARLNLLIQRYRASSAPVPFEIQRRAQEIETWAAATFTPAEGQRLMQMVQVEQQNLLADEGVELQEQALHQQAVEQVYQNAAAELAAALRSSGARQISKVAGIDRDGRGLDEGQLAQALDGKYEVPGRKHALNRAAEAMAKKTGRQYDAADVSTTLKTLGELVDSQEKMSAYLDKHAGNDQIARNRLEEKVRTAVIQTELQRRRDDELLKRDPDAFKPKTVEMTAEERRRLDIADRVLAHDGIEPYIDRIHDRGEPGSIREALVNAVEEDAGPDVEVADAQARVEAIEAVARGE